MATRDQLREIHTGMDLPSVSKEGDKLLARVMRDRVKPALENEYGVSIAHRTKTDAEDFYSRAHPDVQRTVIIDQRRGCLRPDGGILYVSIQGLVIPKMPLLFAEMKKQGTPEKPGQAKGNAVERLNRYAQYLHPIMQDEDIFPLLGFCHGVDFEMQSSIRQRLHEFNYGMPLNQVQYWKNSRNLGGITIFAQEDPYNEKQLFEACYDIARNSLRYYMDKYRIVRLAP